MRHCKFAVSIKKILDESCLQSHPSCHSALCSNTEAKPLMTSQLLGNRGILTIKQDVEH
jgi:hypothetical protein